jgi:hypothetical protein
LNGAFERDFINARKLRIVYQGPRTTMVIAIRPELARPK